LKLWMPWRFMWRRWRCSLSRSISFPRSAWERDKSRQPQPQPQPQRRAGAAEAGEQQGIRDQPVPQPGEPDPGGEPVAAQLGIELTRRRAGRPPGPPRRRALPRLAASSCLGPPAGGSRFAPRWQQLMNTSWGIRPRALISSDPSTMPSPSTIPVLFSSLPVRRLIIGWPTTPWPARWTIW